MCCNQILKYLYKCMSKLKLSYLREKLSEQSRGGNISMKYDKHKIISVLKIKFV